MLKIFTQFRNDKRKFLMGLTTLVCIVLLLVIIVPKLFPPSLVGTANSLRDQWKQGSIIEAYNLAPAWQQKQLPLTRHQLEEIQQNFVAPVLSKVQFLSNTKTDIDPNTGFARSYFYAKVGDRPKMEFYVSSMETEDGVQNDFAQYFYQIWEFEYILKHKGQLPKDWGFASLYEGPQQDRSLLTSLGVPGLPGPYGSKHLQTWTEITNYQNGLIAKYHLAP